MDSSKDNNVLPVDEHQIDELAVQHNGLPVLDEKSSECDGHPEGENQADDLATEKDDALLIDEWKLALQHNKPKRDMSTVVVPADYICTQGDLALIESIKKIPCEPRRVEVVCIGDAFIERKWMECLFQPKEYLGDEVINCYINLLKAQEHLKQRPGGTVHIENTFISKMFQRDADDDKKFDDIYPVGDPYDRPAIEQRVLLYLRHDMVFIPINIPGFHWYLAVLNARKREIQVLDSLGSSIGRNELNLALKGLQRDIDNVTQHRELKDHSWPDLQVASWPLREIDLKDAKQTDGCLCGLFLINYVEYWTGDQLSDSFTQADMTQFRTKLAAILVSSDLNKFKGHPIYLGEEDKEIGSLSDIEMLDGPPNANKRKQCNPSDQNKVEESIHLEDPKACENQVLEQTPSKRTSDQSAALGSAGGSTDELFMSGLTTEDMPIKKEDMIDVLCDYIMAIQDATILETCWVRSFEPYKIELTVKQLQEILDTNVRMTNECFNMGVRALANREYRRLTSLKKKVPNHYMDLRFYKMTGFGRVSEYEVPSEKELAKTLDAWPRMNYHVTGCRFTLMPLECYGIYQLFLLDHDAKTVTMIDFTPAQKWCHGNPYKRFVCPLLHISEHYRNAMNVKCPKQLGDIFYWRHIVPDDLPIETNRSHSGYLILHFMALWNSERKMTPFCPDGKTLRKNFLVDLLTYPGNSRGFIIPASLQKYLARITANN